MSIWLPPAEQRRAFATAVIEQTHDDLERINREVQRIDPHTQIVRADPRATNPQLKPGYYHIIQTPPNGMPTIDVWEGPNGEYREPGSDLFEYLRHSDGDSNRSRREREKRQRELKYARDREKARETEDRREEMYQRLRSMDRTQILVPR